MASPHKSRINLYLPSLRPIIDKLPLNNMVIIWFSSSVLFTMIGLYTEHLEQIEQAKLTVHRQSLVDKQAAVADLQKRHQSRKASDDLIKEMDQLSKELQGKRILSQHLKGQSLGQDENYAKVMLDIAQYHQDQVWLTGIRFDDQGIVLRGYALDAKAVPQWLAGLKQSQFFAGKEFAVMNIEDKNQQAVEFSIHSMATEAQSVDAQLAQLAQVQQEAGQQTQRPANQGKGAK